MIKDMAWNTFKKTGNIDIYLEYTRVKKLEQNLGEINGNNKDKRDCIT